jgi:glycosyltransferase involved in cell wall biosynthesis
MGQTHPSGVPLRILAVGNMYPPHHQGGYELVWQAAMHHARSIGHDVRVLVSTHRERSVTADDEPDVHRTLHWYWDWERHEFPRLTVSERLRIERANAHQLRRHLAEFRPDVVAWWSMGHMSLSLIEQVRRAGLPAVFCVHNDWLVYAWDADQWIRIWAKRDRWLGAVAERVTRIPTRVDTDASGRVVFNSQYTLRRAVESGLQLTAPTVVTPGIEERFLDPLPPSPWQWKLLYAGRIDRFKGVDTAVAALEHLPAEATLTIHGKGDAGYAEELERQALRLGVAERVRFGAFQSTDALRDAYEESDAVLFPVRGDEPWGLVPLEAMGVGRPVISTARGGTAEFVRDGDNALVIEPDDPRAVAQAVERLAHDEPLREALIAGGRRTAARHTADECSQRTVAEIVRAASRSTRGDSDDLDG